MGLLDLIGNVGHGIVHGVDRMAYNALGGGLLGSALNPQLPSTGLLSANPAAQYDPAEGGMVQRLQPQRSATSQPLRPTREQQRILTSQFLMSIGAALQQGRPLAEGIQNYQQQVTGELQANRAQQMQDQKQQMTAAFQQEMQQAGNDSQRARAVLLKYADAIGPQAVKAYGDLITQMQPAADDVIGEPFRGIGPDGKPVLLQHTKSGKVIPVTGYAPPETNIQAAGNGILYDPQTGRTAPHVMSVDGKPQTVILDTRKGRYEFQDGSPVPASSAVTPYEAPKPVGNHFLPGANGWVAAPETGPGPATPVLTPDGKPVMPKVNAPVFFNPGANNADGSPNAMIEGMANYTIPLNAPRGGSPASMKLYNDTVAAVKKINPQFDATVFQAAQKTINDFTSGKDATAISAINTAAGHLSTLANAATALNNGDLTALNRIANFVGGQTGNSALSVYKTIVHRLGPEITRAYIGAGGGEGDRIGAESDFDPDLGANRILANIGVSSNLFKSKVDALQNQFEKGAPGRKFEGFISPEAQATFGRFGGRQPGGSIPTVATQAEYDKLPHGAEYMEDGKKYRKP